MPKTKSGVSYIALSAMTKHKRKVHEICIVFANEGVIGSLRSPNFYSLGELAELIIYLKYYLVSNQQ